MKKIKKITGELMSYIFVATIVLGSGGIVRAAYDAIDTSDEVHNETPIKGEVWYTDTEEDDKSKLSYIKVTENEDGEYECEVTKIEPTESPLPPTEEMVDLYTDFIPDTSKKIFESEELSAELQWYAKDLCDENDIPLEIFMALMYRESCYTPSLISSDGHDYGLCQIRDINHEWISEEIGVTNFLDAKQNMQASMFMLKVAMSYYDDTWHEILMTYNGGPGYAKRLFSQGIYSSHYSRAIMEKARELGYEE